MTLELYPVERVFVYNKQTVAVVLHGDFAIVIGENEIASADSADALREVLYDSDVVSTLRSQIGADAVRLRARIMVACIPPYSPLAAKLNRKYTRQPRKPKSNADDVLKTIAELLPRDRVVSIGDDGAS